VSKVPYLTGFFDGEGCVTVSKNGSIALGIVNTHLPTLQLFQEVFGGSVAPRKQMVNKPQYVWRVYGESAVNVATQMIEFSMEKQDQLVKAIEWMALRKNFPTTRKGRGRTSHPDRASAIAETQRILTNMKKGINVS
jgi:hypothetical protein